MINLHRQILQGDVLHQARKIPDNSINCIITSFPYWNQRDYGIDGQWGLEDTYQEYLEKIYTLMVELKRILRSDGTCWVNLGDTYGSQQTKGLQEKCRAGIPERFYAWCIDNGWIARNHIPWYKPNGMPSSIKDRFTNKWESIFFLVKSKKYFFDLDAVREPTVTESKPFNVRVRDSDKPKFLQKALLDEKNRYNKDGTKKNDNPNSKYNEIGRVNANRLGAFRNRQRKQDNVVGPDGVKSTYAGFNERWANKMKNKGFEKLTNPDNIPLHQGNESQNQYNIRRAQARANGANHDNPLSSKFQEHYDGDGNCLGCGQPLSKHIISDRMKQNSSGMVSRSEDYTWCNKKGKNPGDVFIINPRPFPEAHFATFPPELPEKIIKCGCPEGGLVLDPFFGSGTVGLVAERLNRKWVGIELNPEYVRLAEKRLAPYLNSKIEQYL